jgi:hypothetical protein
VTRLWLLTAVLLALALAGCGPDCDKYCNKVQQCRTELGLAPLASVAGSITACNDSGSSRSDTIDCVIDHTCTDIYRGGHCSPTGEPAAFTP